MAQVSEVVRPVSAFDDQALRYDARVGLPASVGATVAQAIVAHTGARTDDLVVEVGAGTGAIGVHLARRLIRYVGLDASAAMLDVFRAKSAYARPSLIVANCDRPWPLSDSSAAVVFASRVIHLLQPDHVVRETVRVCHPEGLLILGRVVRDCDGIAERLRRRRLDLLQAAGIAARQGEDGTRRVIDGCLTRGGVSLGRQIVAEWTSVTTPEAILAGWGTLPRMGSVPVDPAMRVEILAELRRWAQNEFGDLVRPQASAAHYALDIVRLP